MLRFPGTAGVLLALVLPLRAATLRGVILANEMGGPPVAKVRVAADGANDTETDDQGRFVLGFPGRPVGSPVRVVVNHSGHVVVNDVQLEVNLPERESPFRLVLLLCKHEVREEMARRFYRLKSFEAIEAKYQQQLAELKGRREATYRRATNAVPNSYEACFGYALFSQELNRHELCRPVYERALALARASGNQAYIALMLNNLGVLHRDQNRTVEARQAFEEALAHLRLNVPDYYQSETTQRERVIEIADYLARKLDTLRPEEASAARVLRELVKNQRLG